MAAVDQAPALAAVGSQGEASGRDAVGRVQGGSETDSVVIIRVGVAAEEAEERRLPVVDAEAAEELGVGGEASPALGDDGGAQEVGRLRGEAEEDFREEVVVFQRRRRYRGRRGGSGAAAAAAAAPAGHVALGLLDGEGNCGNVGWNCGNVAGNLETICHILPLVSAFGTIIKTPVFYT